MILTLGDRLIAAGRSDVGCVRTLNEDNFCMDETLRLLVIADGMGGHKAGEVASLQVIASVRQSLAYAIQTPPSEDPQTSRNQPDDEEKVAEDDPTLDSFPNPIIHMLRVATADANRSVNQINQKEEQSDGAGMGSTLVGMWLPDFSEMPLVFHIGDSRLYHYHRDTLTQITQDHSMYQKWVNLGKRGPAPAKNILLQAVGPSEHAVPDIQFLEVNKGDLILLCSDGLTGMVSTKSIHRILAQAQDDNLDDIVDQLVDLAKENGGKDNVTVILGRLIR